VRFEIKVRSIVPENASGNLLGAFPGDDTLIHHQGERDCDGLAGVAAA
jgi:hypothetical protein